jgi:hypothetical protein
MKNLLEDTICFTLFWGAVSRLQFGGVRWWGFVLCSAFVWILCRAFGGIFVLPKLAAALYLTYLIGLFPFYAHGPSAMKLILWGTLFLFLRAWASNVLTGLIFAEEMERLKISGQFRPPRC